MRRIAFLGSFSLLVTSVLGCDSTTDSTSVLGSLGSSVSSATIVVAPWDFLGDVPCSNESGAMQSYVAHIYDVTDIYSPVALPASPPAACTSATKFIQVVVGRQYRIKIDGYDVPASQLVPLGGTASGSRTMRLKTPTGPGPVVAPRWSTKCDDLTIADTSTRYVDKCDPFPEQMLDTAISVDPRLAMKSALPELACKQTIMDPSGNLIEVGDIFSIDVRPDNPSLPALLNYPCLLDGVAPPSYTANIKPGQTYTFRLEARAEADGPIEWGSTCSAVAKESLGVDAVCEPFRSDGAMEIAVSDLFGPTTCATKFASYTVTLAVAPGWSATSVPCEKSVRFSPLAPGSYEALLVGHDEIGNVAVEGTCVAEVAPGLVTFATCTVF